MGHPNANLSNSPQEDLTHLISVYPNPSTGMYFVDTKDIFQAGDSYHIEVIDIHGRLVFRKQQMTEGQPISFDLSDQSTGLYFLHLSGEALHYIKAIQKIE